MTPKKSPEPLPKQEKNKSAPLQVGSPPPQSDPVNVNKINKVVYQTTNENVGQEVAATEKIEEKPQSDMEDTTVIEDIINIEVSNQ